MLWRVHRLGTVVGHGIDGEGNVQAQIIGLARRPLHARARRHAGNDDLGHTAFVQPGGQVGAGKGAPAVLGQDM